MSKTHSQPISKETQFAIILIVGLFLYIVIAFVMLTPGVIALLMPVQTNVGTDPIDKEIVNEAIKYIQPQ